ncbi:MAG: universal stress protein [Bacteroidota bacterium]|nr:universal stress protein [Bacteroidota bacterium]
MEKDILLVPWDFTEVAENALQHAVKISKHINNRIKLIHVVKSLKKGEEALNELNKDIDRLKEKYDVPLEPLVLEGSLFHVISDYASENSVSMVVMGTHGIKGMQKFTGSYALKVIVGSKTPFIVVQRPPSKTEIFKDVVFPLDYRSEAKQKLQWALFLVKYFDVKINIIVPTIKDKSLNSKLLANVHFAEKILDKYDCNYELQKIEGSNSAEESIAFAQKIDADMILIMTTKGIGLTDYVLGAQEQYIIANSAKIPVMVVNPRTDLSRYGSFSATGG